MIKKFIDKLLGKSAGGAQGKSRFGKREEVPAEVHRIDPALVDAIVFDAGNGDRPPHECLSDREFQVLQRIVSGETVGEIGDALNLSAKTISTHKMRLMQKIGVDNNADLIRYALRHGLAQE